MMDTTDTITRTGVSGSRAARTKIAQATPLLHAGDHTIRSNADSSLRAREGSIRILWDVQRCLPSVPTAVRLFPARTTLYEA